MVMQHLTLVWWLLLGFVTRSCAELPVLEAEASCDAEEGITSTGQQLVQKYHIKQRLRQQAPMMPARGRIIDADHANDADASARLAPRFEDSFNSSICSVARAREAPLTDEGFQSVAETCCFNDMKEYVQLVSTDIGLQICDEGGLSGFSPFFSCPDHPSTLADLQSALRAATPASGVDCPWLEAEDADCGTPPPGCGVRINPTTQPSMFEGYVGLRAVSNPTALITTSAVKESVQSKLAEAMSVPVDAIQITMGTGPLASQGDSSLLSLDKCTTCTVYASYSVVQTDPPTLDEAVIAATISDMNATQLEKAITTQISNVAPQVGSLRMTKFRSCEEGSTCKEKTLREDIISKSPDVAKGTMGQDPFGPCEHATQTPVACAVYMGDGVPAKASQCFMVGHSVYACKIDQEIPCTGKNGGDACTFENMKGACTNMTTGGGEPTQVRNYCNIWPIAGAPSTTNMPMPAPAQDMHGCRDAEMPVGAACQISMGAGVPPKTGMCKLGDVGPCDVGQLVPMNDQSVGTECTFAGVKGAVEEHHSNLYCNIWPISS